MTLNAGTAIGASGQPIPTVAANINATSGAGDIWLSNTGASNLTASATGGLVNVVNHGGNLTVPRTGSVTGDGVSLTTETPVINPTVSLANSLNSQIVSGGGTAGNDIILKGPVNGGSGTVTLNSAGSINQTGGIITAVTLTGSTGNTGTTSAALYSASNVITNLGQFTTHGDFALNDTNAGGLTVTGAVNSGIGSVVINSNNGITEGGQGSVTTGTGANTGLLLLGTGIFDLYSNNPSNSVPILAAYTTGASSVQFKNSQSLVVGTVNDSLTGTPTAQKTGITTTGLVKLAATVGDINGDGNGATSARITTSDTASGVNLYAAGGIGIAAPVYTSASAINAISSDSTLGGTASLGGIYLSNNVSTTLTASANTIVVGGVNSSGVIDVANTSGMLTVGAGG